MSIFTIEAPDGRKLRIEAADEATAVKGAQEWVAQNPQAQPGRTAQPSPAVDQFSQDLSRLTREAFQPDFGRPDLMNSTAATVNGLVASVPGLQQASDALIGAGGLLFGRDYNETVAGLKATRDKIARSAPAARMAGELAGTIAVPATTLSKSAMGLTGPLPRRLANSALSMAGYEGAKSLGEGKQGGEVLRDMGIGGLGGIAGVGVGKAIEGVGSGIAKAATSRAQAKATSEAIKGAPAAADLRSHASSLFESSKTSGIGVRGEVFGRFARDLAAKAKAADIDPDLDGEAYKAFDRLIALAREGLESGSLSLGRLHNMRQIAQDVVIDAKKNRTKEFGRQIVNGLDNLISGLKPRDMAIPPNRLGGAATAANDLMQGISVWSRAKKLGLIEEAIASAQYVKSGVENGLRQNFLRLARNPETRKLFTAAELQAIESVGNGNVVSNVARLAGLFGFNIGSGSANVVGGSLGLMAGGPFAALLASAARKGSEKLTERAAQRAAQVAATPNIPVVPPLPNGLLPARQPLEILVRGGVPAIATNDR